MNPTQPSPQALFSSRPLVLEEMVSGLLIALALCVLTAWHFRYFGSTFTDRRRFARVLPKIGLTTCLVISVIRASLALSLGLVGALSIVRFRTPIKEPDELAYVFLVIAIGLGAGAGHYSATAVAVFIILLAGSFSRLAAGSSTSAGVFLDIEIPESQTGDDVKPLLELLTEDGREVELRRVDRQPNKLQITLRLECKDGMDLAKLEVSLRKAYSEARYSFVEQSPLHEI